MYSQNALSSNLLQTKRSKNELKTIPCYKYELMIPSKGSVNLATLKVMFILMFF